jgi:hypothetical protein
MEFENKKLRDVADIAARIMMGEKALHPNQQKLDVHEPEKDELTAKDFEKLRAGKKAEVKKEEVEQIEELKKSTMGSYVKKASKDLHNTSFDHGEDEHRQYGEPDGPFGDPDAEETMKKRERDIENRQKGINRAATKLSKEDVEQIDELSKTTKAGYIGAASKDVAARGEKAMGLSMFGSKKDVAKYKDKTDKRVDTIGKVAKSLSKEEIDHAAEFVLEYESKDGKFVNRAKPGVYGGTKDEKHAVDTISGPKTKELKSIESEKKKKMSEMVATYKEQGLKGLFEALKKDKVIVEEPTSVEFDAQLADAKQRAAGTKKQPEVSKPAVQAVQNEATHTTVEFIDYNDVNGVKISEIDLDERSMTEPEMKKKEQIVKSMKKGISGFKARYGKDAKSVMYATATKRAMGEEVEQIEEGTPDGYQNRDGKLIPKIHPTMTPHEHGHDYTSQSIEDAESKSEIHSQHREILKDNPHPTGSKEHKDWEAGANKAKADHLKDWS